MFFRCDTIISFFDDAQKISVQEECCEECGSQTVNVEYKQEKTKLPNNALFMKGCVFCSTEFGKLVDKPKTAVASRPRVFRGGKTGGRGRGKGRPKQPKDKMAQLAAYFV